MPDLVHARAHTHARIHIHTHTRTHTHTHTHHTHTHAYTYTHTDTHTRTHARTTPHYGLRIDFLGLDCKLTPVVEVKFVVTARSINAKIYINLNAKTPNFFA